LFIIWSFKKIKLNLTDKVDTGVTVMS